MSASSTPSDAAKPTAAQPPASTATPPPAAPKKRAKRPPKTDAGNPPPAKRPKKSEAAVDGEAPVKKTATRKKKKKDEEEAVEEVVEKEEQDRRRAVIEAEEQEAQAEEVDADANTWQDNLVLQNNVSYSQYQGRLLTLYAQMTPEQQERYSRFRAAGISESEFTETVLKPLGLSASTETNTVIRAIGKMFIGELMDLAITVMQEWGDVGPVRPVHLYEAYRRIEEGGKLPNSPKTLKFGRLRT